MTKLRGTSRAAIQPLYQITWLALPAMRSPKAISYGKYIQIRDEQVNAQNNRSLLTPRDAMPILPNIRDYLDEAPSK